MLFLCFMIIATIHISQIKSEKMEKKCQIETGVLQSDIDNYLQLKLPQTKEGKCYGACVMKAESYMNSKGKIVPRDARRLVRKYIKSPEQLKRVDAAIARCSAQGNQQTDECETAYEFMKCLASMRSAKLPKSGRLFSFSPPMVSIQLPPVTVVLFQFSVL